MASGRQVAGTAIQVVGTALGPVGSIVGGLLGGAIGAKPQTVPLEFATDPSQLSKGDKVIYAHEKAVAKINNDYLNSQLSQQPSKIQAMLADSEKKISVDVKTELDKAQEEIDRVAGKKVNPTYELGRVTGSDSRGGLAYTYSSVSTGVQQAQSLPGIISASQNVSQAEPSVSYVPVPVQFNAPAVKSSTNLNHIIAIGGGIVILVLLLRRKKS